MKIINLMTLLAMALPMLSFANCPPPDDSWVKESGNDAVPYQVYPPAGWSTMVGMSPSGTGQVSFTGATILASPSSDPDPYKNLSVVTTLCKYNVNNGAEGSFTLQSLASYTTDLTKNPWIKINPGQFNCYSKNSDITFCAFKGP